MTWALCDNRFCAYHDEGCTLEQVSLQAGEDGWLECADYELDEELWKAAEREQHEEDEAEAMAEAERERRIING